MPFKKGDPNINKTGRPKGSGNNINQKVKDMLQHVFDGNLANIQVDLDNMSPKDKWSTLNKMSDKFLPTLKSIDLEIEAPEGVVSLGFNIKYDDEVDKEVK